MGKFFINFTENQVADWEDKYLNYRSLKVLIKSIINDISRRKKNENNDNESENNLLDDNETIDPILLKKIEDNFPEVESFNYSSLIKKFLAELEIKVHEVYLFYLEIEKQLYLRINSRLYSRNEYKVFSFEEIIKEIDNLSNIAFFCLNFYYYTDQNIEAIKRILYLFDKKCQKFMHINLSNLYFKRKVTTENSDIKYMLRFKIIIEACALVEKLSKDLEKICNKNRNFLKNEKNKILDKLEDLNQYLAVLNDKQTNRLNNKIFDVYTTCPINSNTNAVIKNIEPNDKNDTANSFLFAVDKRDDHNFIHYEEEEFDRINKIQMNRKNKVNTAFCFIHTFLYSFFYTSPYISLYFFIRESGNNCGNLGLILGSTQIGVLLSNIFFPIISSKFFWSFLLSFFLFIISFCISFVFIQKKRNIYDVTSTSIYFLSLSRLLYGLGSAKVLSRKYFIEFLPESKIQSFSMLYLIISNIGLIVGMCFNLLFEYIKLSDKDYSPFENFPLSINKYNFTFFLGVALFVLLIITFSIGFTQPSSDYINLIPMLNQEGNVLIDGNNYPSNQIKDISITSKDSKNVNNNPQLNLSNQMRIFSQKEKIEYSSIEEDIIQITSKTISDTNLIQVVINEIKNKNFANSKTFWICFTIISMTTLITKMILEFIFVSSPFVINQLVPSVFNDFRYLFFIIETSFAFANFPFGVIYKIKKGIKKEKIIIIYSTIIVIILYACLIINDRLNKIETFKLIVYISTTVLIVFIMTLIDSLISFLNIKLLPKNFIICRINIKYIISSFALLGKVIGSCLVTLFYKAENQNIYSHQIPIAFTIIEFILLILFLKFDSKLRVKAVNKLIDTEE